jgi:hypothetical protein
MRLLVPVLATLICLSARADTRAPLTRSDQAFELFGTSFCYQPGCDVKLPEPAMTIAPPAIEHPARMTIYGITFCAHPDPTGPACDVVWMPPIPAAPWRDMPEVTTAEVMPRR